MVIFTLELDVQEFGTAVFMKENIWRASATARASLLVCRVRCGRESLDIIRLSMAKVGGDTKRVCGWRECSLQT